MPNVVTILLIVLAYHSAALAVLLCWRTSVRALPVFLAVLTLHMTLNLIARGGGDVFWLTSAIGLLYGPLIYLLVREASFADGGLHWKDAWLAVPFVVGLAAPADGDLRRWFALLVTVVSLAGAVRVLLAFRAAAALSRTSRALARMHWLVWAVAGAVALAAVDAVRSALAARGVSLGSDDAMFGFTLAGLVALTSWLAFGAAEHVRRGGPLLAGEQNLPKEPLSETASVEAAENFARIERLLQEQALFLEPGLRLADLADAAALTPREASHAINACFGNNFSAYINEYRARHARASIEGGTGAQTFLQIAMASGFSSKTAFNEAFKKLTGFTPTEYARGRPES